MYELQSHELQIVKLWINESQMNELQITNYSNYSKPDKSVVFFKACEFLCEYSWEKNKTPEYSDLLNLMKMNTMISNLNSPIGSSYN